MRRPSATVKKRGVPPRSGDGTYVVSSDNEALLE